MENVQCDLQNEKCDIVDDKLIRQILFLLYIDWTIDKSDKRFNVQ